MTRVTRLRAATTGGPLGRHAVAAAALVLTAFGCASAACWLAVPPPSGPPTISVASPAHRVDLAVATRRGCSEAEATVLDAGGDPQAHVQLRVEAVMPLMGIAMPPTSAVTGDDGTAAPAICTPMTGPWQIRLTVLGEPADTLVVPVDVTG